MESRRSDMELEENQLKFVQQDTGKYVDGVELTAEESKYLLPHFLMLIVGKPGSGKTTIMKQLLTNPQMYRGKFDHVFLISPSFGKMGLPLKPGNMRSTFSLAWIYEQIEKINGKQYQRQQKGTKKELLVTQGTTEGMKAVRRLNENRLLTNEIINNTPLAVSTTVLNKLKQKIDLKNAAGMDAHDAHQTQMMKELEKMDPEVRRMTHANVLFILDDVVADIKKLENEPKLGQLVMNRRHLIHNGTISIMLVTQKYTLIPARIRSNANWMILFSLNPLDFDTVYKDAITKSGKEWQQLLDFVFGGDKSELEVEDSGGKKKKDMVKYLQEKRFDNLGLWVEFSIFFKNFKRIKV